MAKIFASVSLLFSPPESLPTKVLILSSEKRKLSNSSEETIKQKEKKEDTRIKAKPKKLNYKDALELEQIEEKIVSAESEVESIEKIFTSADYYGKYAVQTNELNRQLEKAKEKVKKLYDRWDELEEIKRKLS